MKSASMAIFLHENTPLFSIRITMVNTKPRTKRNRRTTLKLCSSKDSDSDHQSMVSADLVVSNDDLLVEILHRLPVSTLLRFKSVSKHWLSLLSHRRFTLLYDHVSLTPGFFVRNLYVPFDDETPPFRSLNFYPDICGIKILQSCNGLLLCRSAGGPLDMERYHKYYIFNPTTKQYAIIPPVSGGTYVRQNIRFMGLSYHQTDCPHYKLVCIHHAKPEETLFQIQIYSSDTGKWKISDESFSAHYYAPFDYGVCWNQEIHWLPSSINPSYFKLDVEQLQKLSLPVQVTSVGGYKDGKTPHYFGESRGHLHLVDRAHGESHLHLNVYEMLSDVSGWFVKYQVELDELLGAYPEMIIDPDGDLSNPYNYDFQVYDVVRGEEEEEALMMVRTLTKIVRFNLVDKSFKQIFDVGNINSNNYYFLGCVQHNTRKFIVIPKP